MRLLVGAVAAVFFALLPASAGAVDVIDLGLRFSITPTQGAPGASVSWTMTWTCVRPDQVAVVGYHTLDGNPFGFQFEGGAFGRQTGPNSCTASQGGGVPIAGSGWAPVAPGPHTLCGFVVGHPAADFYWESNRSCVTFTVLPAPTPFPTAGITPIPPALAPHAVAPPPPVAAPPPAATPAATAIPESTPAPAVAVEPTPTPAAFAQPTVDATRAAATAPPSPPGVPLAALALAALAAGGVASARYLRRAR